MNQAPTYWVCVGKMFWIMLTAWQFIPEACRDVWHGEVRELPYTFTSLLLAIVYPVLFWLSPILGYFLYRQEKEYYRQTQDSDEAW